jgi:hypothetical protein
MKIISGGDPSARWSKIVELIDQSKLRSLWVTDFKRPGVKRVESTTDFLFLTNHDFWKDMVTLIGHLGDSGRRYMHLYLDIPVMSLSGPALTILHAIEELAGMSVYVTREGKPGEELQLIDWDIQYPDRTELAIDMDKSDVHYTKDPQKFVSAPVAHIHDIDPKKPALFGLSQEQEEAVQAYIEENVEQLMGMQRCNYTSVIDTGTCNAPSGEIVFDNTKVLVLAENREGDQLIMLTDPPHDILFLKAIIR